MDCLIDCLSAWLEKKDGVKNKGCPSWLTLITALGKLEKHHIAANIKAKLQLTINLLHYHSFNILHNFLHDIVLIDYIYQAQNKLIRLVRPRPLCMDGL